MTATITKTDEEWRAQLSDEARRMPGRTVGDLGLFQHQNIALAHPREVIGNGATDGASPDDDDLRVAVGLHAFTFRLSGS